MDIAKLALRGTIGSLFVGHGTQKLFGWFGGHGPEGTGGYFESLGLRPGKRHAIAAGAAEAGGGALLILGAATPLAAAALTGAMTTAIRKVHAPKGPWVTEGGWEYNAVLIGAVAVLAESGPGRPSVSPGWHGKGWALAAVAAGVAGSFLNDQLSSPPPPEDTASAGDPDVTAAAAEQARFSHEQATAPRE
ncbi:MAG TPA: DoxX family protein [Baekduia sp.]|uniref:DoxX family protein n=1 Tax=Baekduia sp. TaxID=2600305 RepID=UPI002D7748F7|nr:DoxX family protein [Baekduia sp.]HET6506292.1 DoxX family protein [Baekduia sp.]